jgi:hypothetical protein
MKKILGSLFLFAALTFSIVSCGGDTPAEAPADGEKKECCTTKEKCEHKKTDSCAIDCVKPCCADSSANKTCTKDSATCAIFKAKCNTECGSDSTVCDTHKAECKAACAAKMDSTSTTACLPDCKEACCAGDEKSACTKDCKKECCVAK